MGLWKNIFISNNTPPHVPPGYIYTVDMFKLYFDPHKIAAGMICNFFRARKVDVHKILFDDGIL